MVTHYVKRGSWVIVAKHVEAELLLLWHYPF